MLSSTILSAVTADLPVERTDTNSKIAHQQLLLKAQQGGIDVYFVGDSITRRWGAIDYPSYLANWRQNFFGWNAGDFGWGGDSLQNILWRLQNGELDGVNPKVIVVLGGTNNIGASPSASIVDQVVADIQAILTTCQQKAPNAKIILTGIFPRNDAPNTSFTVITAINTKLAALADGTVIRFLNVNGTLADQNGTLYAGMMNSDNLHPSLPGYQVWADGLKPILTTLLGAPALTDTAPPPTGDPSVSNVGFAIGTGLGTTAWPGTPTVSTVSGDLSTVAWTSQNPGTLGATGCGQTFTVPSATSYYTLQSICAYLEQGGGGTATLSLYDLGVLTTPSSTNVVGTNLFGGGCGLTLYGYTASAMTGVVRFTFTGASAMRLTVGHTYLFEIVGVQTSSFSWRSANSDTYSGGAAYVNRAWLSSGARDLGMAVYLTPLSPMITSATSATVNLASAFNYTITATNTPTSYTNYRSKWH